MAEETTNSTETGNQGGENKSFANDFFRGDGIPEDTNQGNNNAGGGGDGQQNNNNAGGDNNQGTQSNNNAGAGDGQGNQGGGDGGTGGGNQQQQNNNNAGGGNQQQQQNNLDPIFKQYGFETKEAFETKLKEMQDWKPDFQFASEDIRNLDNFVRITGKKDRNTYDFYQTAVAENPTIDDKLSLVADKMIMENPSLAGLKEALITQKKEELGLILPEGAEPSPNDKVKYALAQGNLDKDYNAIVTDIKETAEKVKNGGIAPVDLEAQRQQLEERKGKWTNLKTEILKNIKIENKDFKVSADGKVEYLENSLEDLIFDDRLKDRASGYIDYVLQSTGYPDPSDATVNQAVTFALQSILWEEKSSIIKKAMSRAKDETIKEIELAGGNVSVWRQKQNRSQQEQSQVSHGASFFRGDGVPQ